MTPNGAFANVKAAPMSASSSMPSSSTLAPVVNAPIPVAPAPVPVLPPNLNGMVSLSAIIHRMSNEAFADLSNLSE
ncbi:hypothetical protein BGW38_008315, partial [Lunasporangiospora selenospora]